MASIALHVDNPPNRLALKAMLEAHGHRIVAEGADLVITERPAQAVTEARERPVLLVVSAGGIADAVIAMRQGVFGYVFSPLQPGEAPLMVQRALEAHAAGLTGIAPPPETPRVRLEDAEMNHILDVLRQCRNNQAKAARALGIGRNTLWRKLRRWEREKNLPRPGPPQLGKTTD